MKFSIYLNRCVFVMVFLFQNDLFQKINNTIGDGRRDVEVYYCHHVGQPVAISRGQELVYVEGILNICSVR